MENIHTHQRSLVAPVPLQMCFFFLSVMPVAVLLSGEDLGREGESRTTKTIEKQACVCGFVSVREKGGAQCGFSSKLRIPLKNQIKFAENN